MNKSKKLVIFLIFLISSLFFCITDSNPSLVADGNITSEDKEYTLNYTPHAPIEITSDDNFTDYGFPGEGTDINPFRIEYLHIQAEVLYGIYIEYVTAHFVIQDCLIEDPSYGIYLYGISWNSCRIDHNVINNVYTGIYVYSVHNGTFFDNTINAKTMGINIASGGYLAVINNTISNSEVRGIFIDSHAGTIITGNKFYGCGIMLGTFSLDAFATFIIENNLVNDKALGYFINQDDLIISSSNYYGQLLLYNCDRAIIRNQDLQIK